MAGAAVVAAVVTSLLGADLGEAAARAATAGLLVFPLALTLVALTVAAAAGAGILVAPVALLVRLHLGAAATTASETRVAFALSALAASRAGRGSRPVVVLSLSVRHDCSPCVDAEGNAPAVP